VPPSPEKTTKRSPGRWGELTVTGNDLVPEVSITLPWLSAEDFERVVHQAADGTGFSFEHDVERRPDLVLGERDIGLDTAETRRRLLAGIGLGVAGVLVLAASFILLVPDPGAFNLLIPATLVGSVALAGGLPLATQSRWESDLLRVRLDPGTTRALGASRSVPGKSPSLSVKVFLGRVTSSSTSTKGGTFRSLQRVLPSPALSGEASQIASRLAELARNLIPTSVHGSPPRTIPTPGTASRGSPNLVPLVSKSGRPEWNDYPRWFVWLRVIALIVPMMLLIFGPFLILLPWNDQRVDFTPGGPSTQSLSAEPWSPAGATSGELWWYTYNPATSEEVNNVPVVVALCPTGATTINASSCVSATGGPLLAQMYGDTTISIAPGWHVVASLNVSEICAGCHTSVRFDAPLVALGIGVTLAGVAVLVPSVVIWLRIKARVKSVWPE
jgi:hypothetical protein